MRLNPAWRDTAKSKNYSPKRLIVANRHTFKEKSRILVFLLRLPQCISIFGRVKWGSCFSVLGRDRQTTILTRVNWELRY